MPPLSKLYLFTYNFLQACGWTTSFYLILSNFLSSKSTSGAYASAGELICWLQTLSFLEVVHGAIGIVPSGVLFPLMQWGGRTFVLLTIVRRIYEVQELPSVFITFVAWSLSEVIRYPYYALNCIGNCPSLITYLRYTAFIVLYPIGLLPGEMWLMYEALPYIKKKNLYADYFAALPFSYYNYVRISATISFTLFLILVLLVFYPFLWLNIYLYMLKQRWSKLGKGHRKKQK